MSDAALRRTVRRGIALLIVPAATVVAGTERYVWSDRYGARPDWVVLEAVFQWLPWLLLIGALAYLVGSAGRQAFGAPSDGSDT